MPNCPVFFDQCCDKVLCKPTEAYNHNALPTFQKFFDSSKNTSIEGISNQSLIEILPKQF